MVNAGDNTVTPIDTATNTAGTAIAVGNSLWDIAITPGPAVPRHFVQTATAANTAGESTEIDNPATNGQPDAVLFVTPNWNVGGSCGCAYEAAPVGVYYSAASQRWYVDNENGSAMPQGAAFNVLVMPPNSADVVVQTATSGNTDGDFTSIYSSLTDGVPAAQLQVTQVLDPRGVGLNFNPHPVGVW